MKLFWTPAARQDRRNIFRHIGWDNPQAAVKLDELFQQKAEHLRTYPAMGRPGRLKGTRELVVHRRYILIYGVLPGEVRILRTVHTSRHWPPAKN